MPAALLSLPVTAAAAAEEEHARDVANECAADVIEEQEVELRRRSVEEELALAKGEGEEAKEEVHTADGMKAGGASDNADPGKDDTGAESCLNVVLSPVALLQLTQLTVATVPPSCRGAGVSRTVRNFRIEQYACTRRKHCQLWQVYNKQTSLPRPPVRSSQT